MRNRINRRGRSICELDITSRVSVIQSHKTIEKKRLTPHARVLSLVFCVSVLFDVCCRLQLHAALTDREHVLMDELSQLHKSKAFTLTEQRDRLRIFQACLESAFQRAKTAFESPGHADLLVARSDIVSTLGALQNQPPVLEPEATSMLLFSVDRAQLLEVLNKAGLVRERSACAETTTVTGSGLKVAPVGREASFTITAHDSQGRLCGLGGDMFVVELEEIKGEKIVAVTVMDKDDGTYLATYTVPVGAKGDYRLSVLLRGAHIQGSPFVVNLVDAPVGRVNCFVCGKRTGSMNYYKNDNEPHRADAFRVNGYSALCYPGCTGATRSRWILVCGPC